MKLIVNIDVPDLERGIVFYRDAVGLELAQRLFDGTVAEMRGTSATVCLLAKRDGSAIAPQASALRDYARHWTPVHLDFEVEDVDAAVSRAIAAGAKLEGSIHSFG